MTLTNLFEIWKRKFLIFKFSPWVDFCADAIAESTKEWRQAWVKPLLDASAKAEYEQSLEARRTTLEKLLVKYEAGFKSSSIGLGEVLVFAQIHDDAGLGFAIDQKAYPKIGAIVQKVLANAAVKKWIDENTKISF